MIFHIFYRKEYKKDDILFTIHFSCNVILRDIKYYICFKQNAYGVGAKCYKLVNYGKPMSWSVANSYCNRTFKGQLATVNDRYSKLMYIRPTSSLSVTNTYRALLKYTANFVSL